ncbi:hypothetical protein BLOT_014444 [Blomia tropicalis]|nr:hypothetical protein BLOT_014444 [Blomia tropicalis]
MSKWILSHEQKQKSDIIDNLNAMLGSYIKNKNNFIPQKLTNNMNRFTQVKNRMVHRIVENLKVRILYFQVVLSIEFSYRFVRQNENENDVELEHGIFFY